MMEEAADVAGGNNENKTRHRSRRVNYFTALVEPMLRSHPVLEECVGLPRRRIATHRRTHMTMEDGRMEVTEVEVGGGGGCGGEGGDDGNAMSQGGSSSDVLNEIIGSATDVDVNRE